MWHAHRLCALIISESGMTSVYVSRQRPWPMPRGLPRTTNPQQRIIPEIAWNRIRGQPLIYSTTDYQKIPTNRPLHYHPSYQGYRKVAFYSFLKIIENKTHTFLTWHSWQNLTIEISTYCIRLSSLTNLDKHWQIRFAREFPSHDLTNHRLYILYLFFLKKN